MLAGALLILGSSPLWAVSGEAGQAANLTVRYFAQIGVGSNQQIRFNTDFVFINSGEETEFLLDFFDSTGNPLSVMQFRNGFEPVSAPTLHTQLQRGETLNLSIRLQGDLKAGYARLQTAEVVSGVIAFTQTDLVEAKIQYQAGVPLAQLLQDFTIPVKFVPGVGDMGFAIVNPPYPAQDAAAPVAEEPARIVFRLYNEAFQLFGENEVTLPAGAHLARFIAQLFPQLVELAGGVGFNGSMTVESSRPLAAISVLHTNIPTLTTVPVTPGRAELPEASGQN